MPLREVLILEPAWSSVPEGRRGEWRRAIDDLLEEHRFERDDPLRLDISIEPDLVQTHWHGGRGLRVEVSRRLLDAHLDEYTSVCRRMGAVEQGASSSVFEALDMAKRVAHDGAARTVQRLFKPLGPDHPTARRMFTLLLTLFVDTTRLTMLHAHRPFRPPKGQRGW